MDTLKETVMGAAMGAVEKMTALLGPKPGPGDETEPGLGPDGNGTEPVTGNETELPVTELPVTEPVLGTGTGNELGTVPVATGGGKKRKRTRRSRKLKLTRRRRRNVRRTRRKLSKRLK